MKKIKYTLISLLGFLIIGTTSCNIDEEYYSTIVQDNYYSSQESVVSALGRPFTHWKWFTDHERSFYIQEYTSDVFCLPTRGSDWYNGGQFQRQYKHTWNADDGSLWASWRGFTRGIAYTLEMGRDLSEVDYDALAFPEGTKEQHQLQLKALRAYFCHRGLDAFGGIPLYKEPINYDDPSTMEPIGRSTDLETFEYTEALYKEVLAGLKPKEKLNQKQDGFFTQAGVAALLARLYFNAEAYIKQPMFDKAAQLSQEIIDGKYGPYELEESWQGPHNFDNQSSKENIIMTPSEGQRIQYDWWYRHTGHYETYKYLGGEQSGYNGGCLTPSLKPNGKPYTDADFNGSKLGRPFLKMHEKDLRKKQYLYQGNKKYEGMFLMGRQENKLTGAVSRGTREYKGEVVELVDIIAKMKGVAPEDLDKLSSSIEDGEENSGIRVFKVPYPDMADVQYRFNAGNPIIRLAEIYYMLAECKLREGNKAEAATLINKVRKRNFEGGIDPDPVTANNLDKWRMLDEWMIEFLMEGEGRRRTDLIRWDLFVTADWWDHKATNDPTRNRFPVPTTAFAGNDKLIQNPGY